MSAGAASDPVRSLAAARTGEEVVIRRILFGALRALCAALGLREGDVVSCRAGTATHLVLRTASGKTIPLDRDWARFIQVSPASHSAPPEASDAGEAAIVRAAPRQRPAPVDPGSDRSTASIAGSASSS
jgi:hypothetical protein